MKHIMVLVCWLLNVASQLATLVIEKNPLKKYSLTILKAGSSQMA